VPPVPAVALTQTEATNMAYKDFSAGGLVNVIELPVCV
jgi:hypothetical protein